MADPTAKKSDLPVRTASAVVMVTVAGTALWLGGLVWTAFVGAVALGVLWEWRGLVAGFQPSPVKRGLWNVVGIIYIGLAATMLLMLRPRGDWSAVVQAPTLLWVVTAVVATDIGAYFAGRSIGGPKIAPKISPSKTWSGLFGGMAGASLALAFWLLDDDGRGDPPVPQWVVAIVLGSALAIVAQAGDFFESWLKRRAGVKDSGKLLPGHGGLFDRVDGLLAVLFVMALLASHSLLQLR